MANQELTQEGPELTAIIRSAVNVARLCLQMEVAFITEFKNGRRIFRHVDTIEEFAPVREGESDLLDESYCQYVVDGQIPPVVVDSCLYPVLKLLACTSKLQIRTHLGVPIRLSDGSVFGTFCCYSRDSSPSLGIVEEQAMSRFAEFFATLMEKRIFEERDRAAVSNRISSAIDDKALQMAYQPIMDVRSLSVVGFEALARFSALPLRGPAEWFEDAHSVARRSELEMVAIRLALADIDKFPNAYLSVNVSPQTILSGSLLPGLAAVQLNKIVLEVTEHDPIENYDQLIDVLRPLRAGGLRLAIDDAGSGYASFRHILRLSPDIIKLDQSVTRRIDCDVAHRALGSALVTFARETGCAVIAEGVETNEELGVIRESGVETVQGYLFGRPAFVG